MSADYGPPPQARPSTGGYDDSGGYGHGPGYGELPGGRVPQRPAERGQSREILAVVVWALVALCWVLAVVLPWYTEGVLRSTSLLEVGQIVRGDLLPVPGATAYGVLLLPVLAAVLLLVAPGRGMGVLIVRLVVLLIGFGAIVTLGVLLSEVGAGSWGGGLWSATLGCVLGIVGLVLSTVRTGTKVDSSAGVVAGPLAASSGAETTGTSGAIGTRGRTDDPETRTTGTAASDPETGDQTQTR